MSTERDFQIAAEEIGVKPFFGISLSNEFSPAANDLNAPKVPSLLVTATEGFGVSSVRHDPSMVAANALSNDLREISGVHPKLPQQSGVSELFGGAFNLVKDVAQALKGQEPANIPEAPDLLMRPAPVMAFLPSAPSIG